MELEQKYIDSREVADMVGKEHSKLLRDIRTYSDQLNESKIGLVEFFNEGTYRELKRQFEVSQYKYIRRNQKDTALKIVKAYHPPLALTEQIKDSNAQMNLEG